MGLEKGKRALEWMQAGMGGERNAVTELCTTAGCTRATLLLCAVLQGWPACRVGLRALCRMRRWVMPVQVHMGRCGNAKHFQLTAFLKIHQVKQ